MARAAGGNASASRAGIGRVARRISRTSVARYVQTRETTRRARVGKIGIACDGVVEKIVGQSALVQVLLFEEKWDDAIAVANQREADYTVVAIVADGVMPQRPEWVIRASKKQALALIGRTQTKYYVHAVEWLERMKKAHAVLNQNDAWSAYLNDLKIEYKRRPALQAQLKRL